MKALVLEKYKELVYKDVPDPVIRVTKYSSGWWCVVYVELMYRPTKEMVRSLNLRNKIWIKLFLYH